MEALFKEWTLGLGIAAEAAAAGQLAAIVVLRTALNFFLQKEIASAERAEKAA